MAVFFSGVSIPVCSCYCQRKTCRPFVDGQIFFVNIVDFSPLTALADSDNITMKINSTIVLTGATSGIGQLAAVELARRGAHLVLTARDKTKAAATCERIHAAAPGARVDVHYADFSSLDSVAALGLEIASRYERIDVLINNAGLHAFEQRVTVDGHAEMLAVNYLAPWLLTDILREALVRSAPIPNCHGRVRGFKTQWRADAGERPLRHGPIHAPWFIEDLFENQADGHYVFAGSRAPASWYRRGGTLPRSGL